MKKQTAPLAALLLPKSVLQGSETEVSVYGGNFDHSLSPETGGCLDVADIKLRPGFRIIKDDALRYALAEANAEGYLRGLQALRETLEQLGNTGQASVAELHGGRLALKKLERKPTAKDQAIRDAQREASRLAQLRR